MAKLIEARFGRSAHLAQSFDGPHLYGRRSVPKKAEQLLRGVRVGREVALLQSLAILHFADRESGGGSNGGISRSSGSV
jgi:hypothetical protein